MSLHENTFGARKCAINLAKMLNERNDPSLTRRVSAFLNSYNSLAKALALIPRNKERHRLALLVRREANAHKFIDTPLVIETHAKNVAIGNLKHHTYDNPKADPDVEQFFNEELIFDET